MNRTTFRFVASVFLWFALSIPGFAQAAPFVEARATEIGGAPYFGWELALRAAEAEPGVVVARVTPGGPAEVAGIAPGDRLYSIDLQAIDAAEAIALREVSARLGTLPGGKKILVSFAREKDRHTVSLLVSDSSSVLQSLTDSVLAAPVQQGLLDDLVDADAVSAAELLDLAEIPTVAIELRRHAIDHLGVLATSRTLQRMRETNPQPELADAWEGAIFVAESRLEQREGIEEIGRVLGWIRRRYVERDRVHVADLTNAAITGMLDSLDPYSTLLTDAELQESRQNRYEGIGISLESWEGRHFVYRVFAEGHSVHLLEPEDEILAVDGENVVGTTREKVVECVRGAAGDPVTLLVRRQRPGEVDAFADQEVTITRSRIQRPVVTSTALPGGIGYLRLHTFSLDANQEVRSAVTSLASAGSTALILDLRGNRGGAVDEVQRIASIFLPAGELVAYSQGREGYFPRRDLITSSSRVSWQLPMVVLVNEGSASAAEMLAGALQVSNRARLLGQRTYGKGVGQSTFDIDAVGGRRYVKLTTFRYYFANDACIQGEGVTPDLVVDAESVPQSVTDEISRLRATGAFRRYYVKHIGGDAVRLAQSTFDGSALREEKDRYPGFEQWFGTLQTTLSCDEAMEALRQYLRLRTEHEVLGGSFVCDLESDRQLQAAVFELAEQAELDLRSEPAYARLTPPAPALLAPKARAAATLAPAASKPAQEDEPEKATPGVDAPNDH